MERENPDYLRHWFRQRMTCCHFGARFLFYWSHQEFTMSFPLVKSLVALTVAANLTIQPALAADKVKIGFLQLNDHLNILDNQYKL